MGSSGSEQAARRIQRQGFGDDQGTGFSSDTADGGLLREKFGGVLRPRERREAGCENRRGCAGGRGYPAPLFFTRWQMAHRRNKSAGVALSASRPAKAFSRRDA